MNLVTAIAFAVLAASGLLCIARLVRGSSLADRIVALDALLVVIVSGIAVHAVRTGDGVYLDVMVVAALLGFVGTVTVARFIERRGRVMAVGDVVAAVLVLAGVALSLLAGIGLQRFPDVFARMHAATKPATLGLMLVLAAAALRVTDPGDVAKLALVAALQFVTAPVGAHMVGRAAYRAGTELSPATTIDELASAPPDGDAV